MAKKKKKKLGRSFDQIMEDDSNETHKEILNEFVSKDLSKGADIHKSIPIITEKVEVSGDTEETVKEEILVGETYDTAYQDLVESRVVKREANEFIWYKYSENKNLSGLGKMSLFSDNGITIETVNSLNLKEKILIETARRFDLKYYVATVLSCNKDHRNLYVSELEFIY